MSLPHNTADFQPLIDTLVQVAYGERDLRADVDPSPIEEWFEVDDSGCFLEYWTDELCVVDLHELAKYEFNDDELRDSIFAEVADHEEVNDHIRVDYARKLISGQDVYSSVTYIVARIPIRDTQGRAAVLGYRVQPIPNDCWRWCLHGVYKTEEAFMDSLQQAGFVDEKRPDVSDADLLKLWVYTRQP